jgi:polyhydroxyalkanoate synthesis repressor PhaR
MADQLADSKPATPPVVVKKYANRRLYNTESSSYVTLDDLAQMVRQGRDFVVYDAKSGDDITRGVLTQIIVEEEAKGSHLLPESFLRQLIGFYGDSLQGVLPRYLEMTMQGFARQQEEMRRGMEQAFKPFSLEEVSQRNMAMMERAMSLFSPFGGRAEVDALKAENAQLKSELEALKAKR